MSKNLTDVSFNTVVDILQYRAECQPNDTAYIFLVDGEFEEVSVTYAALNQKAKSVASLLQSLNLQNKLVLLQMESSLEFLYAFFGCMYAKAIAITSYPHTSKRTLPRLKAILADSGATNVLTTQEIAQKMQSYIGNDETIRLNWIDIDEAIQNTSLVLQPEEVNSNTIAFLQYTSGSTFTPKGVMISHKNIIANEKMIQQATGNGLLVGWLPLFHDMGLIANVLQPLFTGNRCVLMSPKHFLEKPVRWLRAISKYRARISGGPNFAYELCCNSISAEDLSDLDLSSWEIAFNGAEPIRSTTMKKFIDLFSNYGFSSTALTPCYGLAEATLLVSGKKQHEPYTSIMVDADCLENNIVKPIEPNQQDRSRILIGCGIGLSPQEIAIVDPNTFDRKQANEIGEIWINGPHVSNGYWQNEEATIKTFQAKLNGDKSRYWLRTGDLGFWFNNEIYFTGRLKDLIIINGKNHYPQDIELTSENAHPYNQQGGSAVFIVEIENKERLIITQEIQRSYRQKLNVAEVTEAIQNQVYYHHELQVYKVVLCPPGTISKTSSGKIQRYLCRKRYLAGEIQMLTDSAAKISVNAMQPETIDKVSPIKEWLRDFAARRLNSLIADERRCFPPHIVLELGNKGLFGMQVPTQYNGLGLKASECLQLVEQITAIDLSLGVFLGIHNFLGLRPLILSANNELKERYLPSLASGRSFAAFSVSETGSGSNPLATQSEVRNTPRGWLVNARKKWVGLAAWAEVITVFAKHIDAAGHANGTIAICIPTNAAGVDIKEETLTMGMRGFVQNSVDINSVLLSNEHVLGDPHNGFEVVQDAMSFGRFCVAAQAIGVMKRCAQLMLNFAERRTVSTGLLLSSPITLHTINNTLSAISVLEQAVYNIAKLLDQELTVPLEILSACKIHASELAWATADSLMQLCGARGYMEQNVCAQIFRDARVLRIGEGSTEALQIFVGSQIFHNPNLITFLQKYASNKAVVAELSTYINEAKPLIQSLQDRQWIHYVMGSLASWLILKAFYHGDCIEDIKWLENKISYDLTRLKQKQFTLKAMSSITSRIKLFENSIGILDQHAAHVDYKPDPLLRSNLSAETSIPSDTEDSVTLEPVSLVPDHIELQAKIMQIVRRIVTNYIQAHVDPNVDDIDETTSFSTLGIDSSASIVIISQLEKELNVNLSTGLLFEYSTLKSLVNFLSVNNVTFNQNEIDTQEYYFTVATRDTEDFDTAKLAVSGAMNTVYHGWNDELDRQFDDAAVFFLVRQKSDGPITATCRIYLPELINGREFPLSIASTNPFIYKSFSKNALEGGGLMMADMDSVRYVMYGAAKWLLENNYGDVYMTYDIRNKFIERLYLEEFGFEKVEHLPLEYSDFLYQDSKKPVRWQVVVDRQDTRQERFQGFLNSLTDKLITKDPNLKV